MNHMILKKSGFFFVNILIIICFVYSINTQPCVYGTNTTFISFNDNNYYYDLFYFSSCKEFSSFLNNFKRFSFNNITTSNITLKNNTYNMGNYDFSINIELTDMNFSQTNIQNQILNKNDIIKKDGIYIIENSLSIKDVILYKFQINW